MRSQAHSGRSGQAHMYRPSSGPRQPTAAALAAASRLEIVQRPKDYPLPAHSSPTRSAVLVAAGMLVVLGGLWLSLKIFNTRAAPVTAQLATTHPQGYPPEVVKLVADTATAFQQDNLKAARTDVAALQQIAPDHPRLPFFESLLQKLQANSHESTSHRLFQRHTSPPEHTTTAPAVAENDTRPIRQRPGAGPETFSGRTLEQNSAASAAPLSTSLPPGATLPSASDAPTREAQLIQRVAPDYPPDAERRGIEGAVDVSFTVDPEGKVMDVIVIHSEPSDIFDRAAATAVRRWRYEPKLMSGTPVEEHMQVRVEFKLDSANGH
jgi:protein TonB